jgi:capsular polysaccharide biosynthesis protein
LSEQISLFSNAEIIVGPTGAAWTNLLFAAPKTKCFIWAPSVVSDYGCFSNLASIVGADMVYHFYPDDSCQAGDLYRKSYLLDVKQVITDFERAFG